MPLKNSEDRFGGVTKGFHWGMALIIIAMLAVGLTMDDYPLSIRITAYNLHKSFGIVVLALIFFRMGWHLYSKVPRAAETLKPSERFLSKALHLSFYLLLVIMPLTGWAFSSAAGRSVSVFGLFTLPDFVAQGGVAKAFFHEAHEIIAYIIMVAVALHGGAALKHHFIDKDAVLRRMLPFAVFIILFLPVTTHAGEVKKWNRLADQSSITFRPKQMGTEFKGSFSLFSTDIFFDPDNLAASKVSVEIPLSGAYTGASDRDEALKTKEWFDVTQFPTAKFETTAFRKLENGTYEADALLTIRGISLPLTLPFTLEIIKNEENKLKAVMDGSITLDRSKFQIGTGEWADTSIIANEVPVDIHIVAVEAN